METKIEQSIIDENIEKEGLYTETDIKSLQNRLDTINYRLDSLNLQIQGNFEISDEEQAQLRIEKQSLEEEKTKIEQELTKIMNYLEEANRSPESADSFVGSLDEETEEIFSARSIGKATVPKASTKNKKEARKVEEDIIKSDEKINDEFKEQAGSMMSKLEDLFR